MLHLIGKNLWARRYRNGWLLAELIIVSMVIWVLTDPIVVTTHDIADGPVVWSAAVPFEVNRRGRNVQTESCCCLFQISAF